MLTRHYQPLPVHREFWEPLSLLILSLPKPAHLCQPLLPRLASLSD
jgi:hypothetical protein